MWLISSSEFSMTKTDPFSLNVYFYDSSLMCNLAISSGITGDSLQVRWRTSVTCSSIDLVHNQLSYHLLCYCCGISKIACSRQLWPPVICHLCYLQQLVSEGWGIIEEGLITSLLLLLQLGVYWSTSRIHQRYIKTVLIKNWRYSLSYIIVNWISLGVLDCCLDKTRQLSSK